MIRHHVRKTSYKPHTAPLLSALLLSLVCVQAGWAQSSTATSPTPASTITSDSSKLAHADSAFLKDAVEGGLGEIEAGKVAVNKAVSPEVKTFAQQMVDEHTKANADLVALATSKGVKVPTEPSLADKAKLKILDMRDNASFDKHYVKSQVDAHEDAIKLFQKVIKNGKDSDVQALATKTLPTLQHHLQEAKDLKIKTDGK